MITSGASIAARNSATRASSTPSGTAAPRVTRPSSCSIQPTGGRIAGGQVVPGSAEGGQPGQQRLDVGEFACSAKRFREPRRTAPRRPTRVATTSVRRHPDAGVDAGHQQCRPVGAEQVRADVGAEPRYVAATVVDAEPEAARQARERSTGLDGVVERDDQAPDVGDATGSPGQRRGDDVAHPFVAGDGSRPAAATASASAAGSVMPRIWTLPREVSSIAEEPNRIAALASASSWPAEIMPPGSRIRASAPSAAWCT